MIAAGDALLAPSVTRRLLGEFASRGPSCRRPQVPAGGEQLQGADRTGAGGAHAGGQGAVEQRDRGELSISPATAKTHVAHLLTKLGCRDRVQLVIIAYRAGLMPA